MVKVFPLLFLPFISFSQHTLIMKDGTFILGELQSMKGNTISFFAAERPLDIDISTVRTIHFYDTEKKEPVTVSTVKKTFNSGFDRIEYSMDGRNMIKFPKITIGNDAKGIVVVDVTIDKYGNVMSAEPGAAGSKTTDDKYLFYKAKFACQEAKFDTYSTAPLSTSGKVFVVFK